MKGKRLLERRVARQRLLAPHDLAGRGPPGPPALGELAHDLEPAAVLVVAGIYAFGIGLVWSQWLGFGIIVLVVTVLPIERRRVVAEPQTDLVPAPASA